MTLSNAIDAAAAAAEAVLADHSQALSAEHAKSVRAAARAAAVTANPVLSSPSASRAPARCIGGARRRRTPMTLDTKLRVIGWHAAGRTIDYISRQLDNKYDRSGIYKIIKQKDSLLSRAAEGAAGGRASSRAGQYPQVDKSLLEWFLDVRARGRKRVPLSLAILRQRALHVAECNVSQLPTDSWPQVACLTGQSPCIVGIGLCHALCGVTSALFIFYCCLLAYLICLPALITIACDRTVDRPVPSFVVNYRGSGVAVVGTTRLPIGCPSTEGLSSSSRRR